jgi:hypothetical protein
MPVNRKFIPSSWDNLESRLVATHGVVAPAAHLHAVVKHPVAHAPKVVVPKAKPITLSPSTEINQEFASFTADFNAVVNQIFQSPTAASGLSGYIEARVSLMAQRLINYFNNLPIKLPTNQPGTLSPYGPRAAIQTFIEQELVTGIPAQNNQPLSGMTPLVTNLINVPFPTPPLTPQSEGLYLISANAVIETARLETLAGVQGLFNHGSPQIFPTTTTGTTTSGGG